jgi:hypothetical protein
MVRSLVSIALVAAACGGGAEPGAPDSATPLTVPAITALDPAVIGAGSPAIELVITGSGLEPGTVVLFDDAVRAPANIGATDVRLALSELDVFHPRTYEVRLLAPGPTGAMSNPMFLDVVLPNPVPSIVALSPDRIAEGAAGLELVVTAEGLAAGAVVQFAGTDRPTTRIDDARVSATLDAADVAIAGLFDIIVVNPGPGGGPSAPVAFRVTAPATAAGVIERVSVSSTGAQLTSNSWNAQVSGDGRYVVFLSPTNGVVPGDANDRTDVFVRDTCLDAGGSCTPTTTLVSMNADGSSALFGDAGAAMITRDGRYIAFNSDADPLVPGAMRGCAYVRDTCVGAPAGCTPSTTIGSPAPVYSSYLDVSDDGRYVVFNTTTNLVPADTAPGADLYVYDTCRGASGCTPSSTLVTISTTGTGASDSSYGPSISADGRYVAFESYAGNLVTGDTGSTEDVFVRDMCFGAPAGCVPTTTRLSLDTNGQPSAYPCESPSISANGRYVAFTAYGVLSPADTNLLSDLYVADTCVGASGCTPSLDVVSRLPSGAPAGRVSPHRGRMVSDDGRYLAYVSSTDGIVPADTNGLYDVFVRDTCAGVIGCTPSTALASVSATGAPGDLDSGTEGKNSVCLSADARYVVFASRATTLVSGDTNNRPDAFAAATGY